MKRSSLIIASLLLTTFCFGQKKKELEPTKSVAEVVLVGKKTYTYYALSERAKTIYSVTGPGNLTLNYRVRIGDDQFKSNPFSVKCIRSDKNVAVLNIPELLASNLKFESNKLSGSPTRLHKISIKVPPGKHTYEFFKYNSKQKIHMRAFYEAYPKPKWKDLKPRTPLISKQIRFVNSGKIKSYHSIDKQSSFDFSVSDSSSLRIIVRPEFNYKMLEETILKIKLTNLTTGEMVIYKINSSKSTKTEYVSERKATPGSSSTIYATLDKPKNGNDLYSLSLVSGAKSGIVRVSIDENSLK